MFLVVIGMLFQRVLDTMTWIAISALTSVLWVYWRGKPEGMKGLETFSELKTICF